MLLQPTGLSWASLALLLSAGISLGLELKIARSLVLSAARAFLQLVVLGLALTWIFKAESLLFTLVMMLGMTIVATQTVYTRVSGRRYRGIWIHLFLSLLIGCWGFAFFAGNWVLMEGSWKIPEILLPFTGLLLGNSLNGISLGLVHWTRSLRDQRDWIETRLAHGANRWEAVQPLFRETVLTAMTPILNSMSVAGVVSLPGMMTGQLLAGADPKEAVFYQVGALFLISASTLTGILLAVGMGYRTVFNARHQILSSSNLTQRAGAMG